MECCDEDLTMEYIDSANESSDSSSDSDTDCDYPAVLAKDDSNQLSLIDDTKTTLFLPDYSGKKFKLQVDNLLVM